MFVRLQIFTLLSRLFLSNCARGCVYTCVRVIARVKMSICPDVHSQTKTTTFNVYNIFKRLASDRANPDVISFFQKIQEITLDLIFKPTALTINQDDSSKIVDDDNVTQFNVYYYCKY